MTLSGWKTYIVGCAIIIYGIAVRGFYENDWNGAVMLILEGLAIMGLRAGVSKAIKK